jgi:MoaA/NifB/PqqE/SkfB family radical SAM enzyme
MCYFSDPNYKPSKLKFDEDTLKKISQAFFKNALKLQIGCGAEPLLYKYNTNIIKLAVQAGIPHISLTTNGALLSFEKIIEFAKTGLNEIIISFHGASDKIYNELMPGGDFKKFLNLLQDVSEAKKTFSNLKLRLNYTVNPDNLSDLENIFILLEKYKPDVIQIRPIRKLGNSEYKDFDLKKKEKDYQRIINKIEQFCNERRIISILTKTLPSENISRKIPDIAEYTYCYISPENIGDKHFDFNKHSSYRKFLIKNKIYKRIFKDVFLKKIRTVNANISFANYEVNI